MSLSWHSDGPKADTHSWAFKQAEAVRLARKGMTLERFLQEMAGEIPYPERVVKGSMARVEVAQSLIRI